MSLSSPHILHIHTHKRKFPDYYTKLSAEH